MHVVPKNVSGLRTLLALVALMPALLLLCACGGQAPPVRNPDGISQPDPVNQVPGSGTVYIQLSEAGDDIEVTGKVVSPVLEEALRKAKLVISPTENDAELLIHGTVVLRHQSAERRLGFDHHQYGAHATWQVITVGGYRSILNRETTSAGNGVGRSEAITKTLTGLANKISAEVVPFLQRKLRQQ